MITVKTHLYDRNLTKNCDQDSHVDICLQSGLEAQKVEKHWFRAVVLNVGIMAALRGVMKKILRPTLHL